MSIQKHDRSNGRKSLIDSSTSSEELWTSSSSVQEEQTKTSSLNQQISHGQYLEQDHRASADGTQQESSRMASGNGDDKDLEGIKLLSVIFPDSTWDELEKIHYGRIRSPKKCSEETTKNENEHDLDAPRILKGNLPKQFADSVSTDYELEIKELGAAIPTTDKKQQQQRRKSIAIEFPDDFLRIPQHQALKLPNHRGQMEWNIVAKLEQHVIDVHKSIDINLQHQLSQETNKIRTAVFARDPQSGLGMQLREWQGYVYVHSLTCPNGNRIIDAESYQVALQSGVDWKAFGAAFVAGVMPGDQILGVNGLPFLRWGARRSEGAGGQHLTMSPKQVLTAAARMIRAIGDPIVMHLVRPGNDVCLLDKDQREGSTYDHHVPIQHEVNHVDDQSFVTNSEISELTSWHLVNSAGEYHSNYYEGHPLIQELIKRGLAKTKKEQNIISRDLERLTARAAMWKKNSYLRCEPFQNVNCQDLPSPALGIDFVRQALCVHIVNTFVEKDRLAYTIYIVDVESKKEWYAPIRHFVDFQELRTATLLLNRTIEKLPFAPSSWFGKDESSLTSHVKETRRRQLEEFLRGLCNLVYTANVDNATCEIALYVQTFLGCDSLPSSGLEGSINSIQLHATESSAGLKAIDLLKKAIQLYTFRLFLMPTFKTLISRFIIDIKRRSSLIEEKKIVSLSSSKAEKEKSVIELVTVKHVFANILDLILQGCSTDFKAMGLSILPSTVIVDNIDTFIEPLVRAAVQEQIEIEAYVPCRSIISSLLVHGWRYEDRAISYKINYLKQQSQSYFKIKNDIQSPFGWSSVVKILHEGVGRSTLPCNKLNAIVDAGKEIQSGHSSLGADDFLPVFIYCIVNADIDRPCALCALLKHLCNDLQQIGEVGYYLSSFEATIMYIHEMDLTLAT